MPSSVPGPDGPATNRPAGDLCKFISAAPTPRHVVAEVCRRLTGSGFVQLDESARWPDGPGGRFVVRGGSLVAWWQPDHLDGPLGARIIGGHTDSPNLRLKPLPDDDSPGWRRIAVEPYGGVIWNSWLDRDLGIAGHLAVATRSGVEIVDVVVDEPWCTIPRVAIHLDREVNSTGFRVDPARDLRPVWGLGGPTGEGIVDAVARTAGVEPGSVVAADLMLHDLTPPSLTGPHGEFVASSRLDNLVSCWAATLALQSRHENSPDGGPVALIALFDHEEVGSESATGAASTLLADVLERVVHSLDDEPDAAARCRAGSWILSADGAHASHPNRPDLHDARHPIRAGGGPVVKHNANQRYATDIDGRAWIAGVADKVDVSLQHFSMRNDLPCGSTIGPISASRLGVRTVDVGVPQLAMHSARELCASDDAESFVRLLTEVLTDR